MTYGYKLNYIGHMWILVIGYNKPMYFSKMHEALEVVQMLTLHVRPQHLKYVA